MHAIPNRPSRVLQIAAAIFPIVAFAASARADIFQWEYINPADPSQGKQQSTTLAPDGAGVDAVPGANLSGRNLTMAYLIGADLGAANAQFSNLTNADLSQANLFNAHLDYATLTGADFTDTDVRGANFGADRIILDASGNIRILGGITLAQLYSTASYQAQDLSGINLFFNDLASGNFAGQNLTNANFAAATLPGADFTGADVRGGFFSGGVSTGFTAAQLYSTASYQAHNLTGIRFLGGDLTGWNFAGQNLTNATFGYASHTTLTDADFTSADVRGANFEQATYYGFTAAQLYSTASYQAHDLTGIRLEYSNLAGADFAGQNLTNASFNRAMLTGADFRQANLTNANFSSVTLTAADFTDAEVRGADFGIFVDSGNTPLAEVPLLERESDVGILVGAFGSSYGTGITLAQLYSTASYQAHDLSGVNLILNNLAGGNFAGQNLANADFSRSVYDGIEYRLDSAALTDADFTMADARGSDLFTVVVNREGVHFVGEGAIATNLIGPYGHISGLDLDTGGLLVVRDYDGNPSKHDEYGNPINPIPPIPITVDQHLAMGPGGTLRMVFEADAWDSTISFAPGIPVTLGGTLELAFAADVNLASQLGRTFDLFDWTGVNPTGAFAISSPYSWDVSKLYTSGEVTLTAVPEPSNLALVGLGVLGLATSIGGSRWAAGLVAAEANESTTNSTQLEAIQQ